MSLEPTKLVNIEAFGRGWRQRLAVFVQGVHSELLICAPYIKTAEAQWVCERLPVKVRVRVLTDVGVGSVQDGALDLRALAAFAQVPGSEVIALARLHAKVFVADSANAIVTSANLTTSGLDANYEYGIEVHDDQFVQGIRKALEDYALLGSSIQPDSYNDLIAIGDELIRARERAQQSEDPSLLAAFAEHFRAARVRFAEIQVGNRTANQLFGEAIRQALSQGPRTTAEIHVRVQRLLCPLNLNPGLSERDGGLIQRSLLQANLRGEPVSSATGLPFYLLDPQNALTDGAGWWQSHFTRTIGIGGR